MKFLRSIVTPPICNRLIFPVRSLLSTALSTVEGSCGICQANTNANSGLIHAERTLTNDCQFDAASAYHP
jgi:hypothetical protein